MKGFMDMMAQAKNLQAKMSDMQDELAAMEIPGSSGAGLVKITLDGKGVLKGIKLDPSLLKPEDVEILEDLITAAHADARARQERETAEKMQQVTGDLPLPPGMKLF